MNEREVIENFGLCESRMLKVLKRDFRKYHNLGTKK